MLLEHVLMVVMTNLFIFLNTQRGFDLWEMLCLFNNHHFQQSNPCRNRKTINDSSEGVSLNIFTFPKKIVAMVVIANTIYAPLKMSTHFSFLTKREIKNIMIAKPKLAPIKVISEKIDKKNINPNGRVHLSPVIRNNTKESSDQRSMTIEYRRNFCMI